MHFTYIAPTFRCVIKILHTITFVYFSGNETYIFPDIIQTSNQFGVIFFPYNKKNTHFQQILQSTIKMNEPDLKFEKSPY